MSLSLIDTAKLAAGIAQNLICIIMAHLIGHPTRTKNRPVTPTILKINVTTDFNLQVMNWTQVSIQIEVFVTREARVWYHGMN
mmetsp:Transcript_32455/g.64590  ORF Transcript_32455/g.64590 Transcript_32455/m.64590 type:complete len:83 (-) Transcript_32455:421-669(-)